MDKPTTKCGSCRGFTRIRNRVDVSDWQIVGNEVRANITMVRSCVRCGGDLRSSGCGHISHIPNWLVGVNDLTIKHTDSKEDYYCKYGGREHLHFSLYYDVLKDGVVVFSGTIEAYRQKSHMARCNLRPCIYLCRIYEYDGDYTVEAKLHGLWEYVSDLTTEISGCGFIKDQEFLWNCHGTDEVRAVDLFTDLDTLKK